MADATLRFVPTLAEAMRLWRGNLPAFAVVGAVLVPPLVVVEVLGHELEEMHRLGPAIALGVAAVVTAAMVEAFGAGLTDHLLSDARLGRRRMPWWRHARTLPLPVLIGLTLVIGAVVVAGALLLLLPGLAAYAWLALAPPAASFERIGVAAALRRSVTLVRGRYWRVAALTTVTFAPVVLADSIGTVLRSLESPYWLSVLVEAVCEAVIIGFTAAVVVVVFHTLRGASRISV